MGRASATSVLADAPTQQQQTPGNKQTKLYARFPRTSLQVLATGGDPWKRTLLSPDERGRARFLGSPLSSLLRPRASNGVYTQALSTWLLLVLLLLFFRLEIESQTSPRWDCYPRYSRTNNYYYYVFEKMKNNSK